MSEEPIIPDYESRPDHQFKPGNQAAKGGLGAAHPMAVKRREYQQLWRTTVTPQDMVEVIQVILKQAKQGDGFAQRLLILYTNGNPKPTVWDDDVPMGTQGYLSAEQRKARMEELRKIIAQLPKKEDG